MQYIRGFSRDNCSRNTSSGRKVNNLPGVYFVPKFCLCTFSILLPWSANMAWTCHPVKHWSVVDFKKCMTCMSSIIIIIIIIIITITITTTTTTTTITITIITIIITTMTTTTTTRYWLCLQAQYLWLGPGIQAPVVQRLVNAIHWINRYPADKC